MAHGYIKKNINQFMRLIYEKVILTPTKLFKYLAHRREVKKFRKNFIECSPSFDLLWEISDFIKLAEYSFLYDNSIKNTEIGLYSSKNYPELQNGFRVNTAQCRITIKLFYDQKKVCLEIERLKGEGGKTSLSFINGDWVDNYSVYDEMLLDQSIKIMNDRVLKLFDYCYSRNLSKVQYL